MRQQAGRIAGALPRCDSELELPDEKTIYSWIEEISSTPHRRPGTPEGHLAESWVQGKMREIGLEDVTVEPVPIDVWAAQRWSLTSCGRNIPCFYVLNTGFTPDGGITAPLVYVGKGGQDEMERADVKGKIVVADVTFPMMPTGLILKVAKAAYFLSDPDRSVALGTRQYLNFVRQNFIGGVDSPELAPENDAYWQAVRRGAKGVCLVLRDQPSGSNAHFGPYDGLMKPLPGVWVGKYDGEALRALAKSGAEATMVLEGQVRPGAMSNVWGVLPGRSDDVVMLTSHHDSPFRGAIEDGAGVAQVLAQAAAWSKVPKEDRPKTMVFVIDAGHFYGSQGGHEFAKSHPEIMKRTRLLITLEHLAAKEVREQGRVYEETGRLAQTVMFTTPEADIVAMAIRALEDRPARVTAVVPSDFLGPVPTSDAAGYVIEAGVPSISWIGCPYYLLDEEDTLDKVAKDELVPIAQTVAEIVRLAMARG